MGRRKKLPLLENVKIEAIAAEGKALARVDERVLFVPMAVPGDVVDVQVTRKKKSFYEGTVKEYKELSKERIQPKCKHFGVCGGCKWQMLPYKKQLEFKHQQVIDALERVAKVDLPEIMPILGSDQDYYYRNKLEYTFSNRRWFTKEEMSNENIENRSGLGFHIPKMFDKILDIDECHLQPEPTNAIRNWLRDYAFENELSFYDIRMHKGLLRNVIVRNTSLGDLMIILSFGEDDAEKINTLLSAMNIKFPEITSLMYVINTKMNDTINDLNIKCFAGNDFIMEQMEDLKFKIGPKSFYQTNSKQAYELYCKTRDFAQLSGKELVYDLYTGTGTIANFVAKNAANVIGIEYIPEAIEDAKVNSEINKIDNTSFFAGDMKDILNSEFIS
ncbi:MAG: 23S rRNA (uracil(1939)-C(5))-methyltransferase RlmD, partial [Bacteroidales bacterium]|nr:23S rRNA (uracil(1939)-C(5))-methyltransferase RlmD [Bacteroidales bacterium]